MLLEIVQSEYKKPIRIQRLHHTTQKNGKLYQSHVVNRLDHSDDIPAKLGVERFEIGDYP